MHQLQNMFNLFQHLLAQYLSIFQLNLKLDRPVLLGHSQGGWLAQIYAAVFPDKVMYICTSNENISLFRIDITQGSMEGWK